MCLNSLITYVDPTDEIKEGYKYFSKDSNKLYFAYQPLGDSLKVPLNQWLKADNKHIYYNDYTNIRYMSGFHIFHTIEDAGKYGYTINSLTKVKYKNARLIGMDGGGARVIIADEMFVEQNNE